MERAPPPASAPRRAGTLHLLSAGAARGLVRALAPAFEGRHDVSIAGTFGAVGAMRERLDAGTPCDVIVLSAALLDALLAQGRVLPGSVAPLGAVATGIAVPAGAPPPDVRDAPALAAALEGAQALYFPDPARATAGIHFMRVLERLGLDQRLASRLRPHANGAEAMAALARATEPRSIGCTQVTEILYTPGVDLVADLPSGLELVTVYCAGVTRTSAQAVLGGAFVDALCGPGAAREREAGGFRAVDGAGALARVD